MKQSPLPQKNLMQWVDISVTNFHHISFPGNIILQYTEQLVLNVSLSPIFEYKAIGVNVFRWHVKMAYTFKNTVMLFHNLPPKHSQR